MGNEFVYTHIIKDYTLLCSPCVTLNQLAYLVYACNVHMCIIPHPLLHPSDTGLCNDP